MPDLVTDHLPETGSFEIVRLPSTEEGDGDGDGDKAGAVEMPPVPMRRPVHVDTSWHGRHGISRFSAEVLRRIRVQRRYITGGATPATAADVVARWRMRLGPRELIWTPGFNAGVTLARQVLTLHDLIHLTDGDEASLAKRAYYEGLVRPAIRRAGVVLTVSEASRLAIQDWLDDDDIDVIDVGNGCSDLFFHDVEVPRGPDELLYVGNLKPHKNPAPVFAALALVPGARLTVVNRDAAETRALADRHGVGDRVRVVESCTDRELRDLYASSSALLLPSLREGFGLPAVEALAVGTPVIHWAGCGSVRGIVGEHGAAIEDPADPAEWAAAMRRAADGGLMTGRPTGWRSRWSWDGVAGRVDMALQSAAAR